ncbi:hypothetical protein C8Q78DRAFT_993060 [Trametes maxima]|nr:hypothetical protein C8Q78DRAFT_993060 [Trametes maxima]
MAYLMSRRRRYDLEDNATQQGIGTSERSLLAVDEPDMYSKEPEALSDSYEAWRVCANMIKERESALLKAWADQADGLITFAALFSAVVTAFIVETYTSLQPDPQMLMVNLLAQISAQINGTSPSAWVNTDASFKPDLSDILLVSLFFASLLCSLVAAGTGILFKEWVREHTLGFPVEPRTLVRARELRHRGLEEWGVSAIACGIAILLQLSVAFFLVGLIIFVWPLNKILFAFLTMLVASWMLFWFVAAVCPSLSASCPYRSPLSHFIFTVIALVARQLGPTFGEDLRFLQDRPKTLEAWERSELNRRGHSLDLDVLGYLYRVHWGNKRLKELDPCLRDLPPKVSLDFIGGLVDTHAPGCSAKDIVADESSGGDEDLRRLARLWMDIWQGENLSAENRSVD